MKKSTLIRLPLQFFAEGGDNSASADNSTENSGGAQEENTHTEPTLMDLIRSNKTYQAEYDKDKEKSMRTARENERKKVEAEFEEKARVEKMSAEEKAKHEKEQHEKAMAEREAAVAKREMTAEAIEKLAENSLSPKLAKCFDYSSREAFEASYEAVTAAFSEAVADQVNEKLKGGKPPAAATDIGGSSTNYSSIADAIRAEAAKKR